MSDREQVLASALRDTANRLKNGSKYEWGHMGRCNCGHLVQTITKLSDVEIVKTIDHEIDEWTEHALEYCRSTNTKAAHIFEKLSSYGFTYEDVIKLEYLSDRRVLSRLSDDGIPIYLRNNNVEDVVLYMETMAEMLEEN